MGSRSFTAPTHHSRRVRAWSTALCIASVFAADDVRAQTSPQRAEARFEYRGFVIDVSALRSAHNRDSLLQAMRSQFDIVTSVGLDSVTLNFFRTVPFLIDSAAFADSSYRGSLAGYCAGSECKLLPREGGRIKLVPRLFNPKDPVFLHELLHAYHDHRVPDSFGNKAVLQLFEEAGVNKVYAEGSYPLRNHVEYFATTGSVYLAGCAGARIPCPFSRDSLKIRQPAAYAWFLREFGPR